MAEPESSGFSTFSAARRAGVLYAAALASERLRDPVRAKALVRQLDTLTAGDAAGARQARLLAAEVALAAGDIARAQDAMGPEVSNAPMARPEVLLRAEIHARAGQSARAVEVLRTWVAGHPRDAAAWQALALAYGVQNEPLQAIRAAGEARMAHLDYAGAVDRFKAARDFPGTGGILAADHIEASILDTRLRLAESLLREQLLER
jgi:predicted Zn-dependent protease